MLRDDGSAGTSGPSQDSGSPADRRRTRRRRLPFGRGAVLEFTGSSHVVAVVDLSIGGAYLSTRAPIAPGQSMQLRLMPVGGTELRLPCEAVRVITRRETGPDAYPPGVAIRFLDLAADVKERLGMFVEEGRRRAAS